MRAIAMTPDELDEFLGTAHTCRVATIGPDGVHNTPLWFAWDGEALWLTSLTRSQRWTDLERDPRVAVVVDAGEAYEELRGVELRGRAEPVGPAPVPADTAPAVDDDPVAIPERLFAIKYYGPDATFVNDGRHGWLRIVPDSIVSWDFSKIPR